MYEYRIRFSKEKDLKFLSHLELIRTIERSFRRAQLGLAYSEGFHPHPKISFGPALAVGISSIDEYLDFQLNSDLAPEEIKTVLNHSLPEGIQVIAIVRFNVHTHGQHHVKPLNAIINRATYSVFLQTAPEDQESIIDWLNRLLQLPEFVITRHSKDGQKLVNIRPWLHNLTTEVIDAKKTILEFRFTGETGSGGNLRPEDITGNIPQPVEVLSIARIGLWHEENGSIFKPLDLC
jgi:radical SAM-linked protein